MTNTIDIYGEVYADDNSVKEQLANMQSAKEITVNINSVGGDVFTGISIYNMLKRHKAKIIVNVDGLAASIASVIAMAGDVIRMPSNSMMMIHNAMTMVAGNANDLRSTADLLEKVTDTLMSAYLDRSDKLERNELKALLDAETWLSAEEAKELGLIDEVITSKKIADRKSVV